MRSRFCEGGGWEGKKGGRGQERERGSKVT